MQATTIQASVPLIVRLPRHGLSSVDRKIISSHPADDRPCTIAVPYPDANQCETVAYEILLRNFYRWINCKGN
jgi:hypothetical protein